MSTPSMVSRPTRSSVGGATNSDSRSTRGMSGFWFVLPFLVFFVAFLVWPVLYGLWMSFTNQSLTGAGGFAGLANYAEAFTDWEVWRTLGHTFWFTLISSVPLVVIALVMALLVNLGLPGQWLWRLSFFTPFLLMVTVVTLIWVWLFQPDLGLINHLLSYVGIGPINWLSDENLAMWSIAIATIWWTVGFNFLLYLAALQNIPSQLYEAASIDGASGWRQLFSITLPLLKPTTILIVILQVLASLKIFDQIYLMTQGGPAGATRSVLVYVYDTGFTGYRLGYASAISYIFFALIVVIAIAQMRLTSRKES
jgi:ABC-type sugar transport system permease subunit